MTFIPFLHINGSLLFCFTDMSSCEWLGFTQKFLKTNLKNTDFLLRSASRSLLKCHVVLSYFAAYFWLVALLTGSNYTFLLAANLCFQLLLFWYKLAQFLGDKLELFHNSSVMKSLTVWHFSSYYFIYRKATSVLLKVHGFMDVYVAFLN